MARRRSSPSRSSLPTVTTCYCSTSPPTTSIQPSRSAIGIGLASWPGSIVLVSHDAEFVDALAPDIALLLPDGTLDYWSNDLLALVPLA